LNKKKILKLKQVEHIWNEKKCMEKASSGFIIKLHKTFQDDENIYMVMDYAIGGELFSHLRRAGRFPNDVAKFFIAEIIIALDSLHQKNIMYRDLKPENVLLDEKGHVKLTDFGFAKELGENERTWTLCGKNTINKRNT
jgi:serine/threonine protein kinase